MATAKFNHDVEIGVAPASLHEFLCDLHNYLPLHPLIEAIEELPPAEGRPTSRRYRVVDRIPLGPFRFRATYIAELEPLNQFEIHGRAWQSPRIRLHTVYAIEEVDGLGNQSRSRLRERVTVDAPRILRRFVAMQARKSHRETLDNMRTLLESQ